MARSHDRLRVGRRPLPAGVTVVGPPAPLLVTARLRVTNPTAVGRKLTDRLQDLPVWSVAGATGQTGAGRIRNVDRRSRRVVTTRPPPSGLVSAGLPAGHQVGAG